MQRGYIYRHRNSWLLRYYELALDASGQPVRLQRAVRLAPANADYPNKRSVELLADKHLQPINSKIVTPEGAMPVVTFIEKFYLPHCQRELRPVTHKSYNDIFRVHLKDKLGDVRMRDFRTVHAQRLMRQITGVGHRTLLHIKSFLSGAFKYAKREGLLDGINPIMDVSVPGKPSHDKGPAYTVTEIEDMLFALTGVARSVVAVAAFTGLRASEIRGLRVADFDGECIQISRSVWRTHVSGTKTASSRALVPLIPVLVPLLKVLCAGRGPTEYIFAGPRNGPLQLENLVARVIKPALLEKKLKWLGWHAFRRGLGSNLYLLGVKPVVIQGILRHSDIGTTLTYYVVTPDQ